jgi:hypothetical protein
MITGHTRTLRDVDPSRWYCPPSNVNARVTHLEQDGDRNPLTAGDSPVNMVTIGTVR